MNWDQWFLEKKKIIFNHDGELKCTRGTKDAEIHTADLRALSVFRSGGKVQRTPGTSKTLCRNFFRSIYKTRLVC